MPMILQHGVVNNSNNCATEAFPESLSNGTNTINSSRFFSGREDVANSLRDHHLGRKKTSSNPRGYSQ